MSQTQVYIDEKGDTISERKFQKKWRNQALGLRRWDSISNGKVRYCMLKSDLYLKGTLNYKELIERIENTTSLKIPTNSTVIIEYYFKDDLCSSSRDNIWTRKEINYRKSFLNPIKKDLKKQDITLVCLFENGMNLNTIENKKNEYFFIDQDNYFRNKLFVSNTICGSYGIIRPNGQTLVRNGENRPDDIAQHLAPEIWSFFFKP